MAYVALNPVRAKMADKPEQSSHTSIKERIKPTCNLAEAIAEHPDLNAFQLERLPLKPLAKFDGNITSEIQTGIPFSFKDYLLLVDTTGRIQRERKRGFIPATYDSILNRLNIDTDEWLFNTQKFEQIYHQRFSHNRRQQRVA